MSDETISRAELAALVGFSEARIQQLTAAGVLRRGRNGYEALEAATAIIGWLRRDELAKAARRRLLAAQALQHERRVQQHLRRLMTVAEARELFSVVLESAAAQIQRETSALFHEQAAAVGPDEARVRTFEVYSRLRRLLLGFRNAADEACRQIESGYLQDGTRIDDLVNELRRAADVPADDADDADEPTADAPAPAPKPKRVRGRRAVAAGG
jgi:hypothetical protein